jgi:hypothetical protein
MGAKSPGLWTPPKPGEPKPLVSSVGAGPAQIIGPYSWGSHRSRLTDHLRSSRKNGTLSAEDFDRVVTWIDLNAPYYPDHDDYYTANTWGRSPLDHKQLQRLGQLVLAAPGGKQYGWASVTDYLGGPLGQLMGRGVLPVNFTRPELSDCLEAFPSKTDPGYVEALALIQTGKMALAEHPRADMAGYKPCEADQQRLDHHAARQAVEARVRQAIREGTRVYDEPRGPN